MSENSPKFSHAEIGLTRFPPNVEQIRVERDSLRVWLIARRNDVELRFPLNESDCRHLAALLLPTDKSEITPAMIEAGARALSVYDPKMEDLEEGAVRIFSAMHATSKP